MKALDLLVDYFDDGDTDLDVTIEDVLKGEIESREARGLMHRDVGCYCSLSDFAWCGSLNLKECEVEE